MITTVENRESVTGGPTGCWLEEEIDNLAWVIYHYEETGYSPGIIHRNAETRDREYFDLPRWLVIA